MNRTDRPMSPHLTIYRPQINSVMSIFHRITGLGLALGGALLVWWFLAAATIPESFAFVDGLLTSWLGLVVLVVSLGALWYHLFTGIRHLLWDTGAGFAVDRVKTTSYVVLAAAVAGFVITLLAAL